MVQRVHFQEAVWGADSTGLISGYELLPGQAPRQLDSGTVPEALAHVRSAGLNGGFVWLHFDLAHASAVRWLQTHVQLPDIFYEALGSEVRSTRVEQAGDALVAVVNDLVFDFDFDPADLTTLWVCLQSHLVVTARQHRLRSVDALRNRIRSGESLDTPLGLLEHLLRAQCDVLTDIVRQVTRRADAVEDHLLLGRTAASRVSLGEMRRLLVRLRRLMAPEPTSLFRLLQHPPRWIDAQDIQALREVNEEFLVVLADMASLQERIKLLQEELAAAVNEATGRSLFMLTVVTVLALPINILAGLFGMNVGGIPFADNPHGFWLIAAVILVFAVGCTWMVVRRRKD